VAATLGQTLITPLLLLRTDMKMSTELTANVSVPTLVVIRQKLTSKPLQQSQQSVTMTRRVYVNTINTNGCEELGFVLDSVG
jgi:hypothetical protein